MLPEISCSPFRSGLFCLTLLLLLGCLTGQRAVAQSSSAKHEASFRSFDGTNIHYTVEGRGKPVVLVHGFIINSTFWPQTPLYTDLLKEGFQVINLDLRGNGQSDHPHELAAYQNDAEAKDVMLLTQLLGLKSYAVVGYSRGAIIASRLLVLDPRVSAAVLGGMGADFTNPEWPRRKAFYKALSGEGEVPADMQGAMDYIKSSGADREALAQMQGAQPVTSPEELKWIQKPVLVIAGDQDSDNGSAPELTKLLGKGTYESVAGGKHNDTARMPEFSTKIIRFLKAS